MGVACPQLVWNGLGGVSRVLHGLGECGMASLSVVCPHLEWHVLKRCCMASVCDEWPEWV